MYITKYLNKLTDEIVDYDEAVQWICETYHITLNAVYKQEEIQKQSEVIEMILNLDFEILSKDDLEEIKLIENNNKILKEMRG